MALTKFQKKRYKKYPEQFMSEILDIPINTIKWSDNPSYQGIYVDDDGNYTDVWDGTPDPIYEALHSLVRWEDTGIESSTGVGKCSRGDSIVFTDTGMVEIQDLWKGELIENSVSPLFINISGRHQHETTSAIYYSGFKPTYNFKTNMGYELGGSGTHRVLIIEDCKIQWKLVKDLKKGDRVVVQTGADIWGKDETVTPEEAYFLGLIMGDGSLASHNNRVCFTTRDDSSREMFSEFVKTNLSQDVTCRDEGSKYEMGFSNKEYRDRLESFGLFRGIKSHTKFIPQVIMNSPKHVVVEFLRGLFDTDGGVDNRGIVEYTTVSKKMARQVHAILCNLGIVAKFREKPTTWVHKGIRKRSHCYVVSMHGVEAERYGDLVGFALERKQSLIQTNVARNTNKDLIPIGELVRDVLTELKATTSERQRSFKITENSYADSYAKGLRQPSREGLKKFTNHPEIAPISGKIADILNTGYFFDVVEDTWESEEHLYDLSVPGSNSFNANGFVNHNTFICSAVLLWFLAVYGGEYDENGKEIGCSVITLGPKEESLKANLWKEVKGMWPKFSKIFPKAELLSLEIRMDPVFASWKARGLSVGVSAGEMAATKAAGYHDPYMLYILEECPGIPIPVIEAVINTCVDDKNIIFSVGNPDSTSDGLHQFCTLPTTTHIRISSYDHPNVVEGESVIPGAVSQKSIDKRLARYGTEHPLFMSRVQGICPDVNELGLFTQKDLRIAKEHLADPIKEIPVPGRHSEGWIRVYSEVKHTHLNRYLIFGDVAGDSGKGDWHVAMVFDRLKKSPAAIVRMRGPREDYVSALLQITDMYKIVWTQMIRNTYGNAYWHPLLAWERTGVGALIMDPRIKEYPNLFHKRSVDVLNPNLHATIGWDTTAKSRKIMIDELEAWGFELEKNPWRMKDERLWTECSTFVWVVRGQRGRYEALQGTDMEGERHHDDMVMALGGALVIDKLIPEPEVQEKPPDNVPDIKDEYFRRAIMRTSNPSSGDEWVKEYNDDPWAKAKIPNY